MKSLGEGIFHFEKFDLQVDEENLKKERIFLNNLILPCDLEDLSFNQILIINRFREQRMKFDSQFRHRNRIANDVISCLNSLRLRNILEIGCGKFPLLEHLDCKASAGIDIDLEAINYCKSRGLNVGLNNDKNFIRELREFNICVALYVFHFHIPHEEVALISKKLSQTGSLVFNLIGSEQQDIPPIIERFHRTGFQETRVFGERLSSKEFFYVMSRKDGQEQSNKIVEFLTKQFSK